ncbi:MAG: MBOAT family protein [Anaerolineaceae bacterium]|nr:MBOAT family protein [Anaerolineaceae bacterium]
MRYNSRACPLMTFNAPFFLFFFFPAALLVFLAAGARLRVWALLAASLLFYAWGSPLFLPLILVLAAANYWLGQKLARRPAQRWLLAAGLVLNIGLLVVFKVAARYWPDALNLAASLGGINVPAALPLYLKQVALFPLGLSYLAFQGAAYLLDIRKNPAQRAASLGEFSTYFLLFPKLIAGPITRYRELAAGLRRPQVNLSMLAEGARRFTGGLAKKVLIADQLSRLVDSGVFAQTAPNLSTGMAWLVMLAYTLQIYYDFSGYTDMAIGLGQMFGLRLPENFSRPYISRSISEFWRRWHITLSTWFRDYVFYPLERKRHGAGGLRQPLNILIVFLLTGLWHGVSPTFALWGALHGLAIAFENTAAGRRLTGWWPPLQHLYTLLTLMAGWVFFRSPGVGFALGLLRTMAGFPTGSGVLPYSVLPPLEAPFWLALTAGLILALPLDAVLKPARARWVERFAGLGMLPGIALDAARIGLLWVSLVVLAGSQYQPYIYGGF